MASNKIQVEMWACINSDGDYATGSSSDDARERYEEIVGALSEAEGFRLIKVLVSVAAPAIAELAGEVADDEEPAALETVA